MRCQRLFQVRTRVHVQLSPSIMASGAAEFEIGNTHVEAVESRRLQESPGLRKGHTQYARA